MNNKINKNVTTIDGVSYSLLGIIDLDILRSSVDINTLSKWMRYCHPRNLIGSHYLSKDIKAKNGVSSAYAVFVATRENNDGLEYFCSLSEVRDYREKNKQFIQYSDAYQEINYIDLLLN